MPPEVERLRGDRYDEDGLEALRGRRWDAVVDTCGFAPHVVRRSAELLADAVEHYTFVSSASVYRDMSVAGIDESYPVGVLTDEELREAESLKPRDDKPGFAYGAMYGALKALCERAAEEAMPGRVLNVRAGLIVGPFDDSDRFTYWPRRVAEAGRDGGDLLAPGKPERQIQLIDARDLAGWIIRLAEARRAGIYNATGPDYVLTMGRLLEECRRATGSAARIVWVEESFLLEAGVQPWSDLPLWLNEDNEEHRYFLAIGNEKAVEAGLTFRPLAETIRDTLAWDATRTADPEPRPGLTRERELQLLQKSKG